MTSAHFRQSLVALTFAWIGVIAFATHLLVSAEISRHEREFEESVQLLSNQLKNKLDMNEAVLAGFSAFLQAVEGNDVKSATRYAASAMASCSVASRSTAPSASAARACSFCRSLVA